MPVFHAVSPGFRYDTSTLALRFASPSICHSNPRLISVGGSTMNSPGVTALLPDDVVCCAMPALPMRIVNQAVITRCVVVMRRILIRSQSEGSNPMRLAVGDIQDPASINHQAMRPRKCTQARIWLGAVAALARAEHGADAACPQGDFTNQMVFGVGDVKQVIRPRQAFRTLECGLPRLAAIA